MSIGTSKVSDRPFRAHILRHGEVDPAWKGKIYGGMDIGLAPEGRQRFVDLAPCVAGMPIRSLYCSGLSRAIHGASCFAEILGLDPVQDERFNEIERGRWAGLATEEIEERWPGALDAYRSAPGDYQGHGGESFGDLQARTWPALQELSERHAGEDILLVCHAQVLRVLVSRILHIPHAESLRLLFSHGGITTLDRFPDGLWVVQSINAEMFRRGSWAGRYRKP
jgi:broad specificity phosphatase PhoE